MGAEITKNTNNNFNSEASSLMNKAAANLRINNHSLYAKNHKSKVITINLKEMSNSKFLSK